MKKFEKLSDSKFVAMEQNQLNKVKGGGFTCVWHSDSNCPGGGYQTTRTTDPEK